MRDDMDAIRPAGGDLRAIFAIVVGVALMLHGLIGGLGSLARGLVDGCLYAIPDRFAMEYAESIAITGRHISIVPFGVQCSYTANSSGEPAVSVISPWPGVALLGGVLLLFAGLVLLFAGTRSFRGRRRAG